MNKIKIASCQPHVIYQNIDKSISNIINYSKKADSQEVDIICFPECFLQGYIVNTESKNLAIDIKSQKFNTILKRLKDIQAIIVFGMIEKEDNNIYNTAVVIKKGFLLGKYQKVNLI